MSDDIARLKSIFAGAVGIAGGDARGAYLDRECGDNAELRRRVDALLEAHAGADSFWKLPADSDAAASYQPLSELPGTSIGRYKLLEQIGEGGFGVVFRAEQESPMRRQVALKIIKLGMDTRQVVARFEAERQALALMDHPNVAKVFDGGATETGRPYFVMELVQGIPITEYCDQQRLGVRERLELFDQVCQAVQHAHQKGLIHRDIKPTNVLVTVQAGQPVVKVIDFGVAKAMEGRLTEKTLFTEFQQLVGTPSYMSPEQAGGAVDVDTRSDVYSLGVLLYELLTGAPPFDAKELRSKAFAEMQRIICEVEPPTPSSRLTTLTTNLAAVAARRSTESRKLKAVVRGELDWIAMRCLEKDRKRRYQSANALSEDIGHYLSGQPIEARSPSASYLVRKFVMRNKVLISTVGFLAAFMSAATVISLWQAAVAVRANKELKSSLTREADLRKQSEAGERLVEASLLCTQGKFEEAETILSEISPPLMRVQSAYASSLLRGLAHWHAGENRWKHAADYFGKLVFGPDDAGPLDVELGEAELDSSPENFNRTTFDLLRFAPLLVEVGDEQGYERLRSLMVGKFSATKTPMAAERVLTVTMLTPPSKRQIDALRSLPEVSVRGETAPWAWSAIGLYEYRRENYEKAIQTAERCLVHFDGSGVLTSRAGVLIAMAHYKLGNHEQAKNVLKKYRGIIQSRYDKKLPFGTYEVGYFHDWLINAILLREANELILDVSLDQINSVEASRVD